MLRWIAGWTAAVMLTYVVGSVLMTQVVIGGLARFGVKPDLGMRLSMSIDDLAGLSGSYLPLVAVALLVAMSLATFLSRRSPARAMPLCIIAGGSGVLCLLLIMQQLLGLNPLAGARGFVGHLLQGLAGAGGGALFASLAFGRRPRPTRFDRADS